MSEFEYDPKPETGDDDYCLNPCPGAYTPVSQMDADELEAFADSISDRD